MNSGSSSRRADGGGGRPSLLSAALAFAVLSSVGMPGSAAAAAVANRDAGVCASTDSNVAPPLAENSAAGGAALADLIVAALRDNPELRAARYAIALAQARRLGAGVLPNPRLELGGDSDFAFDDTGGYSASLGLTQDFPIAGRLLRERAVADIDLQRATAEVQDGERRLAGEVVAQVYRLQALALRVAAYAPLLAAAQSLGDTARARYRVAEVSELDVNAARLDAQGLQQERALLEADYAEQAAALQRLLGRPAETSLSLQIPLPDATTPLPDYAALQAHAWATRPDWRLAALDDDRAAAEHALARAQRWQDWSVGVGVQQDRLIIDGAPGQHADRALAVNLAIPLPLWSRNRGALAEAQAHRGEAQARLAALQQTIAAELYAAYGEAQRLHDLLQGEQRHALAQRSLRLAQQGYAQGLVSLLEVVQAQRQASEVDRATLDLRERYALALARLSVAANTDIAPTAAAAAAENPQ